MSRIMKIQEPIKLCKNLKKENNGNLKNLLIYRYKNKKINKFNMNNNNKMQY